MKQDRRYLKRITGFTAIQQAKRQGWRAAENMRGRNRYPVGSARFIAWQTEYDKTVRQILDDIDRDYDDSMDGDHDSAMASAGWGTDEDYGGGDERF